nr:DEAD/DEAH box helicase [Pseudofrankia inefficax]
MTGLRQAVSSATYARGTSYALRGNVDQAAWKGELGELRGLVRGSGGQRYTTIARVQPDDHTAGAGAGPASWRFVSGRCSCPVGVNCKHVVALVLAVAGGGLDDADAPDPAARGSAAHDAALQALEHVAAAARRAGPVTVGATALRGASGPGRRGTAKAGAAAPALEGRTPSAGPRALEGATRLAAPGWARSLGDLLGLAADGGSGDHGEPRARGGATPLAIELSLEVDGPPGGSDPRVTARLVRPGRTGWVGAVGWDQLTAWHHVVEFVPEQVRLLREVFALYRAGQQGHGYGYQAGEGRRIDLTAFGSRHLWPMLAEAAQLGVGLVHGRKRLGAIAPPRAADLVVDIARREEGDDGATLTIGSVLRFDGVLAPDLVPVAFVGADGHGVVCVERAQLDGRAHHRDWRIRLASLSEPAAPALRRLAADGRSLAVPAAAEERFREEFLPRLRRLAPVVSGDESFDVPEPVAPALVLRASYGDAHELDLAWEWAYEIGGESRRVPLRPAGGDDGPAWRDPHAERQVLAALDLPPAVADLLHAARDGAAHPAPAAHPGDQPTLPTPAPSRFEGAETMRVTTEVLPLLAGQAGLRVEVAGAAADYREVGDSLRITVTTDQADGETDWFDLGVTVTVDGREVPFRELFLALGRGEEYLLLPDGAYFSLGVPELAALRRLIEEARALTEQPGRGLRISRFQAGLWAEFAALGVVERQAEAWRRQVGGLLALTTPNPGLRPPATLAATLRPYQLDGFRWLAFLWENQLGGILADDMGLGKTLQALALICHAKQSATARGSTGADRTAGVTGPAGAREPAGADDAAGADEDDRPTGTAGSAFAPFLVVAPTSVVSNWAAEAHRFAPGLRTAVIVDTERRRGVALRDLAAEADVVLTSYTLFRLEFDDYAALTWSALVLDEAQMVKNHLSKAYQCARLLPAPFKLAITGTPMENNLMELWSLLSITAPGLFPNPTRFREYYALPIERRHDRELLTRLRARIRPLLLRRTKEQAAPELPPKQEQVLEIDLHPRHRRLYQTQLQRERQKVLGLVNDLNRNRLTILRSLTLLRQLSLHAGLVDDGQARLPSAKIDTLLEQLTHVVAGGHRALVFSQFTGFLGKVRAELGDAGVEYCYLDGRTRDRADVVERFRSGKASVFLISLKAGGFGLNLTEADYCFLLDPWWNPATEAQAVDRTHRIGQTRNVLVYRLVARDTIEEKVMALKARKARLFSGVIDDGDAFGASLTAEDVRHLFA